MSNLTNFSVKEVPKFITNHYEKFIKDQLKNYMKPETDSKLQTFAKCYEEFKIQPYLNNNLPKSIVKHLTKVRISAHTLLIEKGRYHRPKISRNLRLCSSCNKIEDEEHFMLYCNRYDSLRKSLFSNLNINSDYHVHVDKTMSTRRCLLNPIDIQETKIICHFIQSAFSIHCS